MAHFTDKTVYVYMLRCADGSYYVGSTRKTLEERVGEHNAGVFKGYPNAVDAIAFERRLKGWSRAKKDALVAGNWSGISALARRRGGRS